MSWRDNIALIVNLTYPTGCLTDMLADPFPEQHIAYVCREMLAGLAFMHTSHRLHRDIKSDNVLVDRCLKRSQIHACIHTHSHIYIQTYTCTYARAHTHTHTHTHTNCNYPQHIASTTQCQNAPICVRTNFLISLSLLQKERTRKNRRFWVRRESNYRTAETSVRRRNALLDGTNPTPNPTPYPTPNPSS